MKDINNLDFPMFVWEPDIEYLLKPGFLPKANNGNAIVKLETLEESINEKHRSKN